jgi:hypothetical protein
MLVRAVDYGKGAEYCGGGEGHGGEGGRGGGLNGEHEV